MENEAPAIVFTNFKRPDGFEVSLTLRGESGIELLAKMDKAIDLLKEKGCTPVTRYSPSPSKMAQIETKDCPVHNVPMKNPKGKGFYHSRGVYPDMEYCSGKGFPEE